MFITTQNPASSFLIYFFLIFFFPTLFSLAEDSITQGKTLTDGQTLISQNQNFELGFFSPKNSSLRYVGIWYYMLKEQAVVWVANREKSVSDRAAVLRIGNDGNLVVFKGNNIPVWSTNASIPTSDSNSTKVTLGNNGNLIVSSIINSSRSYWESFEHPTDTYIPGMRVPLNPKFGENHFLASWKSENDPSIGNFIMGVDPRGAPQIVIWEGQKRIYRSGHFNLQKFSGVVNMSANMIYGFRLSAPDDDGTKYLTYTPLNGSSFLRYRIRWDGKEEQLTWDEGKNSWKVLHLESNNECEIYNKCGNFGVCTESNSLKCSCIKGFVLKDFDQWNRGNFSGGCIRKTPLLCKDDGFDVIKGVKFPDFVDLVTADSEESCKQECLKNCSCTAYAEVGGIGCMIWDSDLIDIQHILEGNSELNVRLVPSDLGGGKSHISTSLILGIVVGVAIFLAIFIWLLWKFKTKVKDISGQSDLGLEGNQQVDEAEVPFFSFKNIVAATDDFDEENKLGQGGFGPVYKGKLPGGQEIAVKRLSGKSCQGLDEFKNEISLIAKLQHRNLVRLLGYCIQGEEQILIYEYMPNKSLDFCLFVEPAKQAILDWRKRYIIIEGIARGLLYLHRDSRLRIIHRDLKASNILLDEDMNPKIADFGMARKFGGDQNEANTNRIAGTYGYMAPEYAMEGLFSTKSDVYSFGILLLEIISGKRNASFRGSEQLSLIAYAWQLWNEGKAIELVDSLIRDSCSENEAMRWIHVAMLCVQDSPDNRPTMSYVVLMLESELTTLPPPRQPIFVSMRSSVHSGLFTEGHELASSNEMTATVVVGR